MGGVFAKLPQAQQTRRPFFICPMFTLRWFDRESTHVFSGLAVHNGSIVVLTSRS